MLTQTLIKKLEDQKYALDQAAIVAATDARGVITYINDKFCEISGFEREELLGETHHIVNSGYHPKSFFKELWETIAKGNIWRGEVCNRRKNGELYWVFTTIVPFLDDNGSPNQYLSIRYEITELKAAKETIHEQQEQLISASRLSAIGEMAAAITHEINNPLAVILGRVEMMKEILKEGKFEVSEIESLADSIEITGQRIAKIIHSMKTMSHHTQDMDKTFSTPVQSLIDDAMNLCHHRFQTHGVKLVKPENAVGISIDCRSHQVVQVLINLLNNSFDAVQTLQEKWVRVEIADLPSSLHISIIDSGTGISKDLQKKIFDPFFSTKNVQYGTGLGLSISQGILRQEGGTLIYDSHSPNTKFVICLPKKLS